MADIKNYLEKIAAPVVEYVMFEIMLCSYIHSLVLRHSVWGMRLFSYTVYCSGTGLVLVSVTGTRYGEEDMQLRW